MKKDTQTVRILRYIEDHGSITALEAMRDLGCYRLAARVHDLKREGVELKRDFVGVQNRYGEYTTIARYTQTND
jgi:hypothetical protein